MTPSKYIDLFKNKNFLSLWIGQIISEFGDRLNQMALIASVYYGMEHLTVTTDYSKMFRLATLLSFTIIPVFFIGPIAGVYTDRWDKRITMINSDIIRGLLVLLIPLFLIKMHMILPVYIIVFLIFSTTRFFLPAKLGIIPDLVKKENLLIANSLTTTSRLIATILGLGLGGLIIDLVGLRLGFYIDSGTYFLSAIAITLIRFKKKKIKSYESIKIHTKRIKDIERNIFYDISKSIRYILHHKKIPYVLKTFFVLMSGAGAIYIIFIDFILKNLTTPSIMVQRFERIMGFGQFGFIIVFIGLGAFIGTIIFGKWGHRISRELAISYGFALSGLFLFLFSFFTHTFKNFWLTASISLLLGFSAAPIMALANTLLHEVTTQEMRGRVFSTLEIVIHLAFLVFMFFSMFLVTILHLLDVYILCTAGCLAFLYGIWSLIRIK